MVRAGLAQFSHPILPEGSAPGDHCYSDRGHPRKRRVINSLGNPSPQYYGSVRPDQFTVPRLPA